MHPRRQILIFLRGIEKNIRRTGLVRLQSIRMKEKEKEKEKERIEERNTFNNFVLRGKVGRSGVLVD